MSELAEKIPAFRRRILAHYRARGRSSLPWRTTRNPYRILVSEVMLQQTQAPRVMLKYRTFLRKFPSLRALAAASKADVLTAWQGLGYNQRALRLRDAAQLILRNHRGRVPKDTIALRDLPGIGPYTATAIRIFAFNLPDICIETNIRSVFLHEFFPNIVQVPDRLLTPLIQAAADRKYPRIWHEALMDYGSALKRAVPNPSRQSAGYVHVQKFAGSTRYARGRVLALALRGRSFGRAEAGRAAAGASLATLRAAVEGLVRDKLLTKEARGRYRLKR